MPENQPNWIKLSLYILAGLGAVAATLVSPALQPLFSVIFNPPDSSQTTDSPSVTSQPQYQKIVIIVSDKNTKDTVPDVSVRLQTTIGMDQEGLTGNDGVYQTDILEQSKVTVYLSKEGYLDEVRTIDLQHPHPDGKYPYFLIPQGDNATPNVNDRSNVVRPEIAIGDGLSNEAINNHERAEAIHISTDTGNTLSVSDAASKIDNWLNSKSKIFARPYDENLAQALTTGQMLEDNLGSINWLRTNEWNYIYSESRVIRTASGEPVHSDTFVVNYDEGTARLVVRVYENRTLLNKNGSRCEKQSGESTRDFMYAFLLEPASQDWKISFFCRIDPYHNCLESEPGC